MKIYNNPNLNKKHCNGVIAIGNFDGVHLGHRHIIDEMKKIAQENNEIASVLTFEPHPRRFFTPDAPNFRLMTNAQKKRHIQQLGVQQIFEERYPHTKKGGI